jgi:MraZ protein
MNGFFLGSELCEVDADGNVRIPGFVTDALDGEAPELLVSKNTADGCLIGYDRHFLTELHTRAEARRVAGEARGEDARNHYHRMRRTFGIVEKMPSTGATIRIPAAMRHLGRIDRLALFVGAGDSFEIWNPTLAIESEDEQFRDLAAFQLKARGDENSVGVA